MKTTRVYYDTEFLEGTQDIRIFGIKTGLKTKPTIDLISIGMVDEKGNEYYAISKDFNLKEAWNRYDIKTEVMSGDARNLFPDGKKKKVYWIRENVLKPIWKEMVKQHNEKVTRLSLTMNHKDERLFTYKNMKSLIKSYGKSNKEIAEDVFTFCTGEEMTIEKAKYYKPNVPNVELYGYYSAYDHVAMCWLFGKMIDLPPGMPMYTKDLKQELDNLAKTESDIDEIDFNKTLEGIKKNPHYPKQSKAHSAIHDARFNKQLHEFLNNL